MRIETKRSLIDIEKNRNGYEVRQKKRLKGGGTVLNGKKDVVHGDKIELGKRLTVFNNNAIIFTSSEII